MVSTFFSDGKCVYDVSVDFGSVKAKQKGNECRNNVNAFFALDKNSVYQSGDAVQEI